METIGDSTTAIGPLTITDGPAPSIGRIVHYQSYGTPGGEFLPEPRAAIIASVGHDVM